MRFVYRGRNKVIPKTYKVQLFTLTYQQKSLWEIEAFLRDGCSSILSSLLWSQDSLLQPDKNTYNTNVKVNRIILRSYKAA